MLSDVIKKCKFHSCCEQNVHNGSLELIIEKLQRFESTAGAEYLDSFQLLSLPKNNYLLHQGDVSTYVWFMVEGIARVYTDNEQEELTSDFFFANEFVDLYDSSTLRIPSKYSIQLLTDAQLYKINWLQLRKIIKSHSELGEIEQIIVACNLHNYKNRIHQLQHLTATKRYELLLHQHPDILKQIHLAHIASYLGISQERLSRIRKKLKHVNKH